MHADGHPGQVLPEPAPGGLDRIPVRPGAPQGPVPWSRRCAAVERAVSPPGDVESRRRRLAARRTSAKERVLLRIAELGEGQFPAPAPVRPASTRCRWRAGSRWRSHPLGRGDGVVGPGRLEHEGFAGVGHQEGGVVRLPMGGVRDPALPAGLEESDHHVDGLGRHCGTAPIPAAPSPCRSAPAWPGRRRGWCRPARCRWPRRTRSPRARRPRARSGRRAGWRGRRCRRWSGTACAACTRWRCAGRTAK